MGNWWVDIKNMDIKNCECKERVIDSFVLTYEVSTKYNRNSINFDKKLMHKKTLLLFSYYCISNRMVHCNHHCTVNGAIL